MAFYIKKVNGNATFIAALIAETVVILLFGFTDVPYLWFNLIGSVLVVIISYLINPFVDKNYKPEIRS